MKKYAIAVLTLVMAVSLLTGCGCMNSNAEPTTKPTILPTTAPTTAATTMPTTAATTEAATRPSTEATTPSETGTTEATNGNQGRSRSSMPGTGF